MLFNNKENPQTIQVRPTKILIMPSWDENVILADIKIPLCKEIKKL